MHLHGSLFFVFTYSISVMSLLQQSTTSIMGADELAPFLRAKWEPMMLPTMLLMAQGMPLKDHQPLLR